MSGRDISNIAEIMKNDFKGAFSNPIVTLVLIGVIILPSLYALLNIQACWDPYENTGQVEFAIANLDKGAMYENNTLNIGNELVKDLKNNDKFKWTFVTEEELREGVRTGKYYAGIVLPENLTENVLSITSDNPKQAKLEYVVNVKSNPVATKLTDTGANTVYTSLNAKIVEYINLAAYNKLGELQEGLASGANQLTDGGNQLYSGVEQISSGMDQVSSGASQVHDGADQLDEGASQVEDGANQVQESAQQVQDGATQIEDGANQIEAGADAVTQGADELEKGSEEVNSAVDPSLIPDGPVKDYVDANNEVSEGASKLANGSSQLAQSSSELAHGSSKLADGSSQVAGGASQVAGGASSVAGGARELAGGSEQLADGALALAAGAQLLSTSAAQALFTAGSSLASTANSLSQLTGINETILGEYFYAPIKLDRHELFSVPNYGSNVAPFYLVLSMWVGALITCVMIEPKSSAGTKYSPFEMYAGKLMLYIILSILQVAVTLIGAHLLGLYINNVSLFVASAILVSVVFMILIYSIISAVGTVGKGICVVLLVLQISATGGIYPIEIMHQIFQTLYPYMPMTYAITLIREAQLGIVWSNYTPALIILLAIGIITVIVSILIKEKADKASKYFEERLEESGLF